MDKGFGGHNKETLPTQEGNYVKCVSVFDFSIKVVCFIFKELRNAVKRKRNANNNKYDP